MAQVVLYEGSGTVEVRLTDELPTSRGVYTGGELLGELNLDGGERRHTLTNLDGLAGAAKYVLIQKEGSFTNLMLREVEAFGLPGCTFYYCIVFS